MNSKVEQKVERGCPQEGVLSPFLWNFIMDDLLRKLREKLSYAYSQGFADYLAILQAGLDRFTVVSLMQQLLNFVSRWCNEVGLPPNPDKIESIWFTNRKTMIRHFLILTGVKLQSGSRVKNLRIELDSKFNWNQHCRNRVKKTQIVSAQCKRAIGKTWGLSPKVHKWIYRAVIFHTISYGVVVWNTALYRANKCMPHERVQRTASNHWWT